MFKKSPDTRFSHSARVSLNKNIFPQIDAATGESETNASVLRRSVQFARCLLRFGVQPGDVLAVSGGNHLDVHIPYYAALMIGMPFAGVDPDFKYGKCQKVLGLRTEYIYPCLRANIFLL